MKKFNYFFAAAAFVAAMGLASCSQSDNPTEPIPSPEPEPVAAGVQNYDELIAAITEAEDGAEIKLAAAANITIADAITLDKAVSIVGDEAQPANITMTKGIVTSAALKIANANIDASGLEENLLSFPAEQPADWQNIAVISFDGVTVKGLKKALFYSATKNYLISEFVINNSVIEVASAPSIDFTKGSVAANIIIKKSTIYAAEPTTNSFYSSQSGQKATEASADLIQKFDIENSTFYNLAKSKNFFTHRQSNQKWLAYTLVKNIFVNCGKSGQVVKGVNGGQSGQNPIWNIDSNIFNFDGADTSAAESTGDADEPVQNSIATVVEFANAEGADFTQPIIVGDPRWIK